MLFEQSLKRNEVSTAVTGTRSRIIIDIPRVASYYQSLQWYDITFSMRNIFLRSYMQVDKKLFNIYFRNSNLYLLHLVSLQLISFFLSGISSYCYYNLGGGIEKNQIKIRYLSRCIYIFKCIIINNLGCQMVFLNFC